MNAAVVAGPRADCSVDAQGRITVEFALPEAGQPSLLLRRRPGKGREADEQLIRLPLARVGEGGRWRAVLAPGGHTLAEGRWDVYALDGPDAPRQRLTPGVRDLRFLLGQHPAPKTSPLAVRIPYTTQDGFLAIRAWLRTAHAEAGEIRVAGDSLAVQARLIGAPLEHGAAALLRRRGGDRTVCAVQVQDEGGRCAGGFSFAIEYRELTAARVGAHEVWDVFLRPGQNAPRVRIGRLLDDVADKKNIFTFPATVLGAVTVRPYYTVDNDLAVDVSG